MKENKTMDETEKLPIDDYISEIIPLMHQILYSIAIYKTLAGTIVNDSVFESIKREFWINVSDNAIQMAIVNWCKIFGSKKDNPYHYSKLVDSSFDEIESIKEPMVRFRNKYIAHKTNEEVPVPILQGAIDVMYRFEKVVRDKYDLSCFSSLHDSYESYQLRVEGIMNCYLKDRSC